MSKLFKLKAWLTLEEAAQHLSIVLSEPVTVADVLRLGLDRHLTLSVNFVNHAQARFGRVLPFKDVPTLDFPPGALDGLGPEGKEAIVPDGVILQKVDAITEETPFIHFEKQTKRITGVWDLPMRGGERIDVEARFHELTGGPTMELVNLSGTFVKRSDHEWAMLMDKSENRVVGTGKDKKVIPGYYYSVEQLPDDCTLVVRTDALREFERRLVGSDDVQDAPFFDADAADYPELLHIAVRAWEHARQTSAGTPKQRVLDFLADRYPLMPQSSRDAIAQVVNWQRSGGRPARRARTGG